MRFIRCWILLLIVAVSVLVTVAQEDVKDDQLLIINYTVDDPLPCTRQHATTFYETLDGFQQQIDSLALVKDMDALGSWFYEHNLWIEENWAWSYANVCDGTDYLIRALHAQARYRVLERMFDAIIGFSVDDLLVTPRADTLDIARAMADIDLAAMERSADPDVALDLNSVVNDVARCSKARALEFYATIDGFEENADLLLKLDTWQTLKTWVLNFHFWRNKAWGAFYEQHCGATLMHTYHVESKIYLAGLMQMAGAEASDMLVALIEEWRGYAEYDIEIIEAMTSE